MVALINSFSTVIIIYSLLFITSLLVILIFSSKRFSPIPYFPTKKKDLPLIVKVLNLKKNQAVFDLGAGDGLVIFEAAKQAYQKKLNTKFIAVEINPILIFVLYLCRFFHPNKKNVKVVWGNFFEIDFKLLTFDFSLLTFYLYISPWFLDKVAKKILHEFPNAKIVSYMYPIKSLKNVEKVISGKNSIYIYSNR